MEHQVRLNPQERDFLKFLGRQTEIANYTYAFRTRSFRHTREMAALAKKLLLTFERRKGDYGQEIVIRLTWLGVATTQDHTIMDPTP